MEEEKDETKKEKPTLEEIQKAMQSKKLSADEYYDFYNLEDEYSISFEYDLENEELEQIFFVLCYNKLRW